MKLRSLAFFVIALAGFSSHADLDSLKARLPDLVKAKDAGLVGEQRDGLVGLVDGNAPAAVKKLVEGENADRRALYETRSQEQSKSIEVFSAVMGEARIKGEKKGRKVQSPEGSWISK